MLINELLKTKKITKGQYDIYLIFEANELGKNLFNQWVKKFLLSEDHTAGNFQESGFSFFFGRVSFVQDIFRDIEFVKTKLKELENAG